MLGLLHLGGVDGTPGLSRAAINSVPLQRLLLSGVAYVLNAFSDRASCRPPRAALCSSLKMEASPAAWLSELAQQDINGAVVHASPASDGSARCRSLVAHTLVLSLRP